MTRTQIAGVAEFCRQRALQFVPIQQEEEQTRNVREARWNLARQLIVVEVQQNKFIQIFQPNRNRSGAVRVLETQITQLFKGLVGVRNWALVKGRVRHEQIPELRQVAKEVGHRSREIG